MRNDTETLNVFLCYQKIVVSVDEHPFLTIGISDSSLESLDHVSLASVLMLASTPMY